MGAKVLIAQGNRAIPPVSDERNHPMPQCRNSWEGLAALAFRAGLSRSVSAPAKALVPGESVGRIRTAAPQATGGSP